MILKYKNQEVEFDHFKWNEGKCRRMNLLDKNGDIEGIWAVLQDKDLDDYKNNVKDEQVRVCICSNNTLAGIRFGSYLPYILNGDQRPNIKLSDIGTKKVLFCKEVEEQ